MLYLVSGFMRSGTSMMMSCLEAGGMDVVKSAERDQFGEAHSDEHYKVNAGGLYEPNPAEMQQPGWPKQHDGKVLKVVVPWLRALSVHDYRVVFLLREPEEIRQSYEGAFGSKFIGYYGGRFSGGKPSQFSPQDRTANIQRQVTEGLAQLRNRRDVKIITQHLNDVIEDPVGAHEGLIREGWPIDLDKAVAKINPHLHRYRLRRLVVRSGPYAGTVLEPNLTVGL